MARPRATQGGGNAMPPALRLYEDTLANDGAELTLPARPYMIYVVHGSIAGADRIVRADEGFGGEAAAHIKGGPEGATLWRWEFAADGSAAAVPAGSSVVSREKFAARLDALPEGPLLLRGDSVAFPPGGCAYRHRLRAESRPPHRPPRPLALARPGQPLVRNGARAGIRASDRPADAFHPDHDPAHGLSGAKLGRISSRGRQGEAENAEL